MGRLLHYDSWGVDGRTQRYFHSSQESLIQPTNNMEQQIKLTYEDGDSTIEFTINPHITLDKMVENMECFLKAIGYQFNHLNYTSNNFNTNQHKPN
jgi:hypothetical protein